MHKLVVITNGNYFAHLILDELFQQYGANIEGVLIVTGDYKARTGLSALWGIGKNTAFPYLSYKVITIIVFKLAQLFFNRSCFSVERASSKHGIPIKSTVSVNSSDALKWVASHEPDLLVSVSCPQMIKREVLSLSTLGGVNIHSSLLPQYAGLAPYFWVLSRGEEFTGTTVHYMTQKFDEGNILVQKETHITPQESAFHLFKRLAILGSTALREAVELALSNYSGMEQDLGQYSYFSNPTFASYLRLRNNGHYLLKFSELFATIGDEVKSY